MNPQEILKQVRNRWVTMALTALVTILAAVGYTMLQTPLYQASTRMFVSTTALSSSGSATDLYQSSRYSQDRVLSYVELVKGETVAQRTIDRLDLEMSPATLESRVTAKSKLNTVLIDVAVLDPSPVRARDIANALSEEFVVLVNELETPSNGARPEARVVVEQRASVPDRPVIPKTGRNIAVGVVLGAILGIGLAILREQLDRTVKTPEAVEEITANSVVGYIPLDKSLNSTPAISFDTNNSPAAEAFRKIRTNLQFLSVDHPPRLIIITSATPSEGKSTTSINIALALAEAGHKVVLVDADMRRPSLAKYLDSIGSVGLSTVLGGGASLDDVLQDSKFPGVTILSAGPTPPNPSGLLGSQVAKKIFGDLSERFDYVIVDTPPLLAVTDGAILAAEADGTLVVVRAGSTRSDQLSHAIATLNDVGAPLLGTVLTMIPTRGSGAYAYNYYYSGGHYGDAPATRTPNSAEAD